MDHDLAPMLCQSGSVDEVPTGEKWAMEPKIDGWRARFHKTADGKIVCIGGRNGHDYSGQLPYIEEQLAAVLPNDTAVDGELASPGGIGDVAGVMTAGTPARAALVPITFYMFDITLEDGEDLRARTWAQRRERLDALDTAGAPNVERTVYLDSTQASAEAFVAAGFEGAVCKRVDSRYINSRSSLWVKFKPSDTAEARVTGFKAGKAGGQWDGKVGAFEIEMLDEHDQPNGATTTVKCGVDANHESATRERDENTPPPEGAWVGAIIEIRHNGIGRTGVPRHPGFVRRRDDKQAPRTVRRATTNPKGPRMVDPSAGSGRNYVQMGDGKLLASIKSLRERKGDAFNKCVAKLIDPNNEAAVDSIVAADLARAESVAEGKGLAVPA